MNSRITAILVVLAATACEGSPETDSPTGPHTEFRGSADIRIVENTGPPEGSRLDWRLGPEPLVSIGKTDGEEPYLLLKRWPERPTLLPQPNPGDPVHVPEVSVGRHQISSRLHGVGSDPDIVGGDGMALRAQRRRDP